MDHLLNPAPPRVVLVLKGLDEVRGEDRVSVRTLLDGLASTAVPARPPFGRPRAALDHALIRGTPTSGRRSRARSREVLTKA
ncbi:hypothetical protein [Lentzea aerocolonigenes]|uniref:hypothetical protein n=1 Tax=Lentzea aerocolonigenes TaxID=68170 RepID=UPI0005EC041B|nr:hypothetical protein [Lentzea aerocolonigenes]